MGDIKGMALYKALNAVDCNVKVGAKDGSGYVYCGKPDLIKIHEANAKCVDKREKAVAKAKNNLSSLIAEMTVLRRKIENATTELYLRQDELKNCGHLLKRQVVETFKSIDEPNTLIVLFDGDERGLFWTTDECKNKKGMDDDNEQTDCAWK